MTNWMDKIKWTDDGLIPVIVQDYISNKVLMFAWMNRQSLETSIEQKKAVYWSRSRKKLWVKGESSGHFQYIQDMVIDCDLDVLMIKVKQEGGISCHTGRQSCFYYKVNMDTKNLEDCEEVIKNSKEIYENKK